MIETAKNQSVNNSPPRLKEAIELFEYRNIVVNNVMTRYTICILKDMESVGNWFSTPVIVVSNRCLLFSIMEDNTVDRTNIVEESVTL